MRVTINGRGRVEDAVTGTADDGSESHIFEFQSVDAHSEVMISIGDAIYWLSEDNEGNLRVRAEGLRSNLVVRPEASNAITLGRVRW